MRQLDRDNEPASGAQRRTRQLMGHREIHTLTRFALGSLAGVTVDLALFQALHMLLLSPFIANTISSTAAICVTYALVTRYVYNVNAAPRAFLAFFAWYACSILAFSTLIEHLVETTAIAPILLKVLSLPASFVANYFFTRLLFAKIIAAGDSRDTRVPRRWPMAEDASRRDLILLGLAVFAALAAATLLASRHPAQSSDSLFLEDVANDLFVSSGRWSDWRLTPAPAFFPDMLLYFIGYKALPDAAARITFVTLTQWVLLGACLAWIVRKLTPRITLVGVAAVTTLYAAFTYIAARTSMWVFFDSVNNHYAALLLPIASLAVAIPYLDGEGRRRRLPALAAIAFLGQLSTNIFLLGFTAPLILASGSALFVLRGPALAATRQRVIASTVAVCAGTALAAAATRAVVFNAPLEDRTSFTDERVLNSVEQFMRATLFAFRSGDARMTLFTLSIVACGLYVFARSVRATRILFTTTLARQPSGLAELRVHFHDWRLPAATWLALWSLVIAATGSVLTGGFADIFGYRYFSFSLALIALIAVAAWLDQPHVTQPLARLATTVVALCTLVGVGMSGAWVTATTEAQKHTTSRTIARCLDDLRASGVDLSAGIAEYWDARAVRFQTRDLISIIPVQANLQPFYWMSTSGPLLRSDAYASVTYDFAIFTPNAWKQFGSNTETVQALLPAPAQRYSCGTTAEIWRWQGDGLDRAVRAGISRWTLSRWAAAQGSQAGEIEMPAAVFQSQVGSTDGLQRSATVGTPSGYLIFGPYMKIVAGSYTMHLTYRWTGASEAAPLSTWDIGDFARAEGAVTLASGTIDPQGTSIDAHFEVGPTGLMTFETRVLYGGGGDLVVSSMALERDDK
jgi:putative flippase GtrA